MMQAKVREYEKQIDQLVYKGTVAEYGIRRQSYTIVPLKIIFKIGSDFVVKRYPLHYLAHHL